MTKIHTTLENAWLLEAHTDHRISQTWILLFSFQSESESGVMVGTMRHPVPLSAVLHFLEWRLIPAIDWICHYRAAMEMRVHGNITLQM